MVYSCEIIFIKIYSIFWTVSKTSNLWWKNVWMFIWFFILSKFIVFVQKFVYYFLFGGIFYFLNFEKYQYYLVGLLLYHQKILFQKEHLLVKLKGRYCVFKKHLSHLVFIFIKYQFFKRVSFFNFCRSFYKRGWIITYDRFIFKFFIFCLIYSTIPFLSLIYFPSFCKLYHLFFLELYDNKNKNFILNQANKFYSGQLSNL